MRGALLPRLVVLALTASAIGCTGDDAATTDPTGTTTSPPDASSPATTQPVTAPRDMALQCDPLDEHRCLLPWPNDAFTEPDPTTATGRRLAIETVETPRNTDGVSIDVTDQNRGDGFSPASTIVTYVADLDPEASGIPDSTEIAASLDPDSPIVLLDATAGTRLPYWAELDAQAPPGEQLLLIRPGLHLPEGHRIVVAIRDLVTTSGRPVERTSAFEAALEGTPEPEERNGDFQRMFADLRDDGIEPEDLLLAWDFTVASGDSQQGRALAMRDQAIASLGEAAPAATVSSSVDDGGVRTIEGTIGVPNFLTGGSGDQGTGPGARLTLDAAGLPVPTEAVPVADFPFRCVLPVEPAAPVPPIVYGHGLLGSRGEIDSLAALAAGGVAAVCAVDWIGMSNDDIDNVTGILGDVSRFPEQADRMLQALLNVQWLARALRHPDGLVAQPAFRTIDDTPVIAVDALQFVGNSQGGILGGAASALTDQWDRAVLGVPGAGYNTLLTRSSNWPRFQTVFDAAYPDAADRVIALELIQLLWDRGENAGYSAHLTYDPLPGASPTSVLLIAAYGDHQVANVATATLARSIGAELWAPVLTPGDPRSTGMFDLIPTIPELPHRIGDGGENAGAALVVWDYGTPAPPVGNLPPAPPEYGIDPHGAGASEPGVFTQALTFLFTGQLTDACGGGPCVGTPVDG